MKKLTLLLASLFCVGFLSAQTSKGNLFLGGNGSFSRTIDKQIFGGQVSSENVNTDLSIVPLVGFFIADGIVVGGALEYSLGKSFPKGSPDLASSFGTFLVGPFARYYHHTDYFGEVLVTFGNTGSEGFKNNLLNWSVGIGKAIFFNEFVAIEPMIVYQSSTVAYGGGDKGVNSGPGIKLGFSIFIE